MNSYRPENSMKALISLGIKGHFPLFYPNWIQEACLQDKVTKKLSQTDRAHAKMMFIHMTKHRSLEHKKIYLHSLSVHDRNLFIKAFLKLVEGKILDHGLDLQ